MPGFGSFEGEPGAWALGLRQNKSGRRQRHAPYLQVQPLTSDCPFMNMATAACICIIRESAKLLELLDCRLLESSGLKLRFSSSCLPVRDALG